MVIFILCDYYDAIVFLFVSSVPTLRRPKLFNPFSYSAFVVAGND